MISPLKQYILEYEAGDRTFDSLREYVADAYGYALTQQELDTFRDYMILEDFLRHIMHSGRAS